MLTNLQKGKVAFYKGLELYNYLDTRPAPPNSEAAGYVKARIEFMSAAMDIWGNKY